MKSYKVKLSYTVDVWFDVGATGERSLSSKIEDLIALPLADQIQDDDYSVNLNAVDYEEVL